MTQPNNEPMLDPVNSDLGMSRHMSRTLKILADTPGIDKDLRQQLSEIIAGRGSLRDLARSEAFTRMSEQAMPAIAADLARRTPEEMQQLARAGEEILARYRNLAPEDPPPAPAAGERATEHGRATAETSGKNPSARHSVIPGTRKPDRDRVVTPEEPDDDDLYYRDRRDRGWLQ